MADITLARSTIEALGRCITRLIAEIAIPDGSFIRGPTKSGITEVDWLRVRFTDGSELEIWPESVPAWVDGEAFVLCAEFRDQALHVPSGAIFRTQRKFTTASSLTAALHERQVRDVEIASSIEEMSGEHFRHDRSIRMTLDDLVVEFITDDSEVLPMSLGVRHITGGSDFAF